MNEDEIRDILVKNLSVINKDYTFLEKEKYLKNDIGTRGFIDIFAQNKNGKYVVIELKRSKAASREAIHELCKYFEAVKNNLSCNSDDIELVIVSTEWDELIVPFSSFVKQVSFTVYGYKLNIEKVPFKADRINPLDLIDDRFLSAVQVARYYLDEKSLKIGIEEHEKFFKSHEIKNFVLIILKSPDNYYQNQINSLKQIHDLIDVENKIPDLKYIIYSSNQLLSEQDYVNHFKKDKYYKDEYKDNIEEILSDNDATSLDKLERLNDLLIEQEPFPDSDHVEKGTPAKFRSLLDYQHWEIIEIKKYGSLNNNILLSNDLIIQEISGGNGTTGQSYEAVFNLQDKASFARVKRQIGNCLSDNYIWRNHIFEILDELQKEGINEVQCDIYNPMNIIYTIFHVLTNKKGSLYIPNYSIIVKKNNEERLYLGYLDGTIKDITLNDLFNKFYDYGEDEFLQSLTWGGYTSKNIEMTQYIGLNYKTKLVKNSKGSKKFYNYENYRFTETIPYAPICDFYKILTNNTTLVCEIINYFALLSINL